MRGGRKIGDEFNMSHTDSGAKIIRRRGNNGASGVQGCLGELLDCSQFTTRIYIYIYMYMYIYICASGGKGCIGELQDFSHFTARNPRYYTFTRYTHTHTHTYMCVCVCARVYMLSCVYICSLLPEVYEFR